MFAMVMRKKVYKYITGACYLVKDFFKIKIDMVMYKYYMARVPRKISDSRDKFFFNQNICGASKDSITISEIADRYLKHEFDVLNSNWENFSLEKYKLSCLVENEIPMCYKKETEQALSVVLNMNSKYSFINWHLDIKSGMVYPINIKSKDIKILEDNNVDIKIPWELSRCQHFCLLSRIYGIRKEEKYAREIICQIIDFIALNPIGYGVNWKCPMDIGIRVSNWIMALKMLEMYGYHIPNECMDIINNSIYKHLIYIRFHLENTRNYRGNHYLANIVGILFITSYLDDKNRFVKRNFSFARKELFKAIEEQFLNDGGNFEASIAYHKLSLEMVLYGLWLIRLSDNKNDNAFTMPDKLKKRVVNACLFMLDAIKPNNDIYQLGDNDSGRLFKFFFSKKNLRGIVRENLLNCDEILDLINSFLFGKDTFFKMLLYKFDRIINYYDYPANKICLVKRRLEVAPLEFSRIVKYDFYSRIDIDNLRLFNYKDFGVCGLRSNDFYLAISYANNGQNGRGGHAHNDKLSFELQVNGKDIESDPGSYVYTPSKKYRDMFRSTRAHNSLYLGLEQNIIGENCFQLIQRTEMDLLCLSKRKIALSCIYDNIKTLRIFKIYDEALIVEDQANVEIGKQEKFPYYSYGYGDFTIKREDCHD